MNLSTLACGPHVLGYVKIGCENNRMLGAVRTRNRFFITARHHDLDQADRIQDAAGATFVLPKLAPHPAQAALESIEKKEDAEGEQGVREIPVRMFFNKVENALSIKYQAYGVESHAPVCSGDGQLARRHALAADNSTTLQEMDCPSPERCALVQSGAAVCRLQVRMPVQIVGQSDLLSVFEVRTGSLNTYRALRSQLQLIAHRFGGLRHVPLRLVLWEASNEASNFQPFSLMRLELAAASEHEAMRVAQQARAELAEVGINDDVDEAVGGCHAGDHRLSASSLEFQARREFFQLPIPGGGIASIAAAPEASTHCHTTGLALSRAASVFIDKAFTHAAASAQLESQLPNFP
jgi:hypothetical protein